MQNLWSTLKYITSHPVNRRRKLAALYDFLKWQMASRILRQPVVVDWIHDTKLVVETGEAGLTGNLYTGLHEFVDMAFVLHCIRSADLFVDIGANRGSYTILASGVCHCQTIAIEPIPETFKKLILNVKINELESQVECFNLGLADHAGKLYFSLSKDSVNHVVDELVPGESIEVPVKTLDEVLGIRSPRLLKIDVEGYEYPILQGAKKVLTNKSLLAVIVEVNDSANRFGYSNHQVAELLMSYGFEPCEYEAFERKLTRIEGYSKNSCNTIFAREPDSINELVKSSPRISIRGCTI